MEGSLKRVQAVMNGQKPDRVPLFDLIVNDAVLTHFNDGKPVACGDHTAALRTAAAAIDGCRTHCFAPSEPGVKTLPDGRTIEQKRWTAWHSHLEFDSSDAYAAAMKQRADDMRALLSEGEDQPTRDAREKMLALCSDLLAEDFFFAPSIHSTGLMGVYGLVGLEAFSYYMADCESTILDQLEVNTAYALSTIEYLPDDLPFDTVFLGDDIAWKNGPMVSPVWMRQHYFPLLGNVINSWHDRGIKVMFHSDGNLNPIMDDLVGLGIDALNPIEVAAGMDIADLHQRYPDLIFVGGIDVSQLLPFGTPEQVRDAVNKAVDDSEGQILVGSSTELHDDVPLENFLAMRQAAMEYSL